MGTTADVGTGGGEVKTSLGSKTSQTAHTSHNADFMQVFVCEVFWGSEIKLTQGRSWRCQGVGCGFGCLKTA